jgi:cold shock CspA family protein
MKDKLINSYLNHFVRQHNRSDLSEAEAFERFINYYLLSKEYPEPFDFEDITVGGDGGDSGIDGIAVVVNEHLVSSAEAIRHCERNLHRLDVKFIFIQTKTTPSFDEGAIGSFLSSVRRFFVGTPTRFIKQAIIDRMTLKDYIYEQLVHMERNPTCMLYYVTTGRWTDEARLRQRIDEGVADLQRTELFSNVAFFPIGATQIHNICKEANNKTVKQLRFERRTTLPHIDKVKEAYIGIVPCVDYLNLICDSQGNLQRSLFYDNVRDFLGNNVVNSDIQDTIRDSAQASRFALLNNGITIVAKDVKATGDIVTLTNFQIVNGCQTSHVLYRNKESLTITNNMYIPLKLISTYDPDVTALIIQGTNSQTVIPRRALISMLPFHKKLEDFYSVYGRETSDCLYYERRTRQYENTPALHNDQIVTISDQLKCFVAMFLNEPHSSTCKYPQQLLDTNERTVFQELHNPYPYYISAYAYYTLRQLVNQKQLSRSMSQFTYHILMIFRLQEEKHNLPLLNHRKIEEYCDHLYGILADRTQAVRSFEKAIATIRKALSAKDYYPKNPTALEGFTRELLLLTKGGAEVPGASVGRERGTVKSFSDVKGYGFIQGQRSGEVFVHYSDIRGKGFRWLEPTQCVEFAVLNSNKGRPEAKDVEIIKRRPEVVTPPMSTNIKKHPDG